MEFGYITLITIGAGVIITCFVRILLRVASNKKKGSDSTYVKYNMKRKYGEEPTLA